MSLEFETFAASITWRMCY